MQMLPKQHVVYITIYMTMATLYLRQNTSAFYTRLDPPVPLHWNKRALPAWTVTRAHTAQCAGTAVVFNLQW